MPSGTNKEAIKGLLKTPSGGRTNHGPEVVTTGRKSKVVEEIYKRFKCNDCQAKDFCVYYKPGRTFCELRRIIMVENIKETGKFNPELENELLCMNAKALTELSIMADHLSMGTPSDDTRKMIDIYGRRIDSLDKMRHGEKKTIEVTIFDLLEEIDDETEADKLYEESRRELTEEDKQKRKRKAEEDKGT